MQGICSPFLSPKCSLLPVTSTREQFSLLARRKYEMDLAKRADLLLERCSTTSPHLSTATAYLSYSFSDSGRALRISPFLGVHFVMITFEMSFQSHSLTKSINKSSSIDKFTSQMDSHCAIFDSQCFHYVRCNKCSNTLYSCIEMLKFSNA